MSEKAFFVVCLLIITGIIPLISSKTVDLLLSTHEARTATGQFVTAFTFTGGGPTAIRYSLGSPARLEPRLYMFSWELMPRRRQVTDNASCHKFFDLAVDTFRLTNRTGRIHSGSFTGPFRVALLYADALTCGPLTATPPPPTLRAAPPALGAADLRNAGAALKRPMPIAGARGANPNHNPNAHAAPAAPALAEERSDDSGHPKADERALLAVAGRRHRRSAAIGGAERSVVKATTNQRQGAVANERLACHLELFNPDTFGEPTNHFGAEEMGLLSFFQVLTLCLFVGACISVPKLWPHLAPSAGGTMRSVITLTTAIAGLQFLSYFLMMVHLQHYARNGVEGRFCEAAAELLDLCCQFLMLHLLLCWSFAARRHEERVWSGPVAKAVFGLAIFQMVTFLGGEIFSTSDAHVYHNYNGSLQLILLFVRVALASTCALYLFKATKGDRSAIKRDFFTVFSKICLVWFLCYPVIYVLASLWREYTRYKFTTMTVCLCQTGCLLLLYRLFISRSLFWEVSALSGALPIVMKFDKKYGLKASP